MIGLRTTVRGPITVTGASIAERSGVSVQEQPLAGLRALLIGAGTEIGRAIAVALAGAGAGIAVASATTDGDQVMAARRTRRAVEALGRRSAEYAFDTALGQNVQVSTRQVAKELGGLDVLVNAQDYLLATPTTRTSDAEWTRTLALNLGGVFYSCRAAVREMSAGGVILNVIPALTPALMAGATAYAAARFGLVGLTRALALEYAATPVRSYVLTAGSEQGGEQPDAPTGVAEFPCRSAAELGVPQELGALAVHLVQTRPAQLNGLCIAVEHLRRLT